MDNGEVRITATHADTSTRQKHANSVLGVVLNNRIPEQTRALGQAKSQVLELTAANHRKDETLAIVSHELRSPLAAIRNALTLLGSRAADHTVREKARGMIDRQVSRMTRIVEDLLDVSRLAQNRLTLSRERLDLRDVLHNAIETLEPEISHKKQRLTTSMPEVSVWSRADACRLEQVFINLIANASRYTDVGGDLTVWMHIREGQAVIRVRDTGIGIAPALLPRVFDLFEQGNKADSRSAPGLGIGLAVVRDLVRLHGGSVTAASAGIGQGSEFTVILLVETRLNQL